MGRRALDLTGQRFGRLKVVRFWGKEKGELYWTCDCDCGYKGYVVRTRSLRAGLTTSCGCIHAEVSAKRMKEAQKKRWPKPSEKYSIRL